MRGDTVKSEMEFETSYSGDTVIPKEIGRIRLGDGNVVRIMLYPDGVHVAVNKDSPFVHLWSMEDISVVAGLGKGT